MARSVKVINRSKDWPRWLIEWLVRKSCADAGVTRYTWTQVARSRPSYFGRGGRFSGHGGVNRRCYRALNATLLNRDSRYPTTAIPEPIPHTSVAMLAFLIRHEVAHASEGRPSAYAGRNGRTREFDMEDACNEAAGRFVRSLRDRFPEVLREWIQIARKDRLRRAGPTREERIARNLLEKQARLSTWERKLKLAQGKVKKYRSQVRRYERLAASAGTP